MAGEQKSRFVTVGMWGVTRRDDVHTYYEIKPDGEVVDDPRIGRPTSIVRPMRVVGEVAVGQRFVTKEDETNGISNCGKVVEVSSEPPAKLLRLRADYKATEERAKNDPKLQAMVAEIEARLERKGWLKRP